MGMMEKRLDTTVMGYIVFRRTCWRPEVARTACSSWNKMGEGVDGRMTYLGSVADVEESVIFHSQVWYRTSESTSERINPPTVGCFGNSRKAWSGVIMGAQHGSREVWLVTKRVEQAGPEEHPTEYVEAQSWQLPFQQMRVCQN